MKTDLSGKTAVITGSTAGVGYVIASSLARAGANVVLNGRKADAVERAVARLSSEDAAVKVVGLAVDVGTAHGCDALVAAYPLADILINNVGIYGTGDFLDFPDAEWTRYFETNVMSGVRLARGYLPGMLKRYWGRVIFMSSEWSIDAPADMIHYGFTKASILSISRCLAKYTSASGVTVNAILPGPIMLDDVQQAESNSVCLTMEESPIAFQSEHRPQSVIQHATTAREVASLVVRLCSPQAAATTGATVRVDEDALDSIV